MTETILHDISIDDSSADHLDLEFQLEPTAQCGPCQYSTGTDFAGWRLRLTMATIFKRTQVVEPPLHYIVHVSRHTDPNGPIDRRPLAFDRWLSLVALGLSSSERRGYELYAAVCHEGATAKNGHYYAFVCQRSA